MTLPEAALDWGVVAERAVTLFAEGLRVRSEQDEVVLLKPTRWGKPEFDRIRQEMVWPVFDSGGRELPLVLPHTAETASAVTYIERQAGTPLGLLGLVRMSAGRIVVEPVTLYRADEWSTSRLTPPTAPKGTN
jgi:hypothetical protein